MQLRPEWNFEEALAYINAAYPPSGYVNPQIRNRQVEAWGQLVGRTRVLEMFDIAVKQNGSLTALGRNYNISPRTLKNLRQFFEDLPDDLHRREREIISKLQLMGQESKTVDAKRELVLKELGDKAEFVKDVVAMANNAEPSFLVVGLDDGSFAPIGKLTNRHSTNDINQMLADKIDPPVVVEYKEFVIGGNEYAIVEINGQNPPYLIARDIAAAPTDRKKTRIYKGTIYVRHADRTEGVSRAELEKMLKRIMP